MDENIPTIPYISLIYRKHAVYLNDLLKNHNLTFGLHPILIKIFTEGPISQEDLAKSLHLNQSTVTRNLDKLENKGLIKKTPEKRKKIVDVTDEGSLISQKVMDYDEKWDEIIKKDLSEEEYINFKDTLIKICEGLV